jgi:hypothetical protein
MTASNNKEIIKNSEEKTRTEELEEILLNNSSILKNLPQ